MTKHLQLELSTIAIRFFAGNFIPYNHAGLINMVLDFLGGWLREGQTTACDTMIFDPCLTHFSLSQ
jgi:hypothetical protein